MARNRQKAKERQARRKAQSGRSDGKSTPPRPKPSRPEPPPPEPEASENGREEDAVVDAHLRAGAPPEDVGRSDEVLEYEQDLDSSAEEEALVPADRVAEEEELVLAEDVAEEDLTPGPRGRRGSAADRHAHAHRPRLVQFLFAVWAELQRVQWPDRQALTTLTGVVLGFVLIAGGYLGFLDAVFSRIIREIL